MKKLSLLLAILLIVSFGVSAADASTEFYMGTKVSASYGLKIHDNNDVIPATLDDWGGLTLKGESSQNSVDVVGAITLKISAMTNISGTYKATASALPLSADNIGTKIGYTVNSTPVAKGATDPVLIELLSFTQGSNDGLKFATEEFTITLSSADLEIAQASDDYATTWTIELTHN